MKSFQRLLAAAPAAALLSPVLAPASGLANDVQLNLDSVQGYSIAQATTIRDFSDVYPTDWAYKALSELVETYGCVSGSGGLFRGQDTMTRFEMAAVLNSCLGSISAKMDMMGEEMKMSAMEDMDTLEKLVASFEEELITLKGSVDGLDAKVSELEDSQFSTTTKASFEIATDFTYFASKDLKDLGARSEDNSGIAMSSSAEIEFETSFTGSDKLTFKLKGDVISSPGDTEMLVMSDTGTITTVPVPVPVPGGGHYLYQNFYDVADSGKTNVKFTGFTYETSLDLGGIPANLTLGTDYADFDGVVGLDNYYGGGGYDGFGPSDFGDAGIGLSVDLLSSDAGTMTASASYAVDGKEATDQTGKLGIFGKETDLSGVLALSWKGALFGGNDAVTGPTSRMEAVGDALATLFGGNTLFTVAYQNIKETDLTKSYFHLVAGSYFTDTISLSGSYSFGNWDYDKMKDEKSAQWMIGLNMDDAIFPGNSAGIAYGTPEYTTDPETDDVMQVLELYYTFSVNDNFEIPVYLDFISNVAHQGNADAFAIAVRPTLTF